MLKLDLDLRAVNQRLDGVTKAAKEAVRPAAQAGAQVLYEKTLQEVPMSTKGHWFHGSHKKYWFDAGSLKKSIYQVYSKSNSADGKAVYHISFNHTEAPYGFMVLRGTSRAPANDFIGRAFDASSTAATLVVKTRLEQGVKKAL